LRKSKPIDADALIKEARTSEHKEAYKLLERNHTFRIGVGARVDLSDAPSFFIEIIISLCSNSSEVDLQNLEKILLCLRALQAREYSMVYQDGNCISCERSLSAQSLPAEYEAIKSLVELQ
jgi:hypothetical protein